MDKYFLVLVIGLVINHCVNAQQTIYVSQNEGDNIQGNGSIQNPYQTIGKAVSVISEGDTIIIREGIYHEEITINNYNATENQPTTIKNYPNETVVIDGTIDISGTWADDPDDNNIKLVENITSPITQLFVGNDQMIMARWPNAQFDDLSIFDKHNWAEGDESTSLDGQLYIDETKKDPGTINLTNSIGILNVGSFKTFNRLISYHTQQSGNDLIEYSTPIGEEINLIGGQLNGNPPLKNKHHYFFFEGKKEFIDVENEWLLDTTNDNLYLYPPSGVNLNNVTVRGKIRDYSLLIENSSHIKIEGLTFFATTLKADNSSYLNISNCNFYYPSHSRRMLKEMVDVDPLGGAYPTTLGSSGTKRVHNSTIESCLFMDAEGEGLLIMGDNNKVLNSYFKNIDWSATELDGLMVTINVDGSGNEFSNNEVYNTGASATVWPGEESIFSYNVVSNTGLAQSDGAVFQGTKNTVAKSTVHHNFVYDTEKYAFRYDAPGGNADEAGSFGVMHHNIADNTMGLMIKGNNQVIANNTVINSINNRNDIIILAEDCSNNYTWLYNNLAERIGSHRSSTQFELSCDAPIPIGSVGYISDEGLEVDCGNNDPWRPCDVNDGNIFSGTGTGQSLTNIDQISVARTGISLESDVTSLLLYNSSDGKSINDYVPNSNGNLINAGSSPTTPVNISLTESKPLNELVPQTSVGDTPDIGAIDESNLWTAGINWNPVEEFQIETIYMTLSRNFVSSKKVFIYPNPTTGIIKIANVSMPKWKIYNLLGQLLQTGNTNWIDISDQENGLYLLQFRGINIRSTLTIIKK
jgi:hypothetical protein